MCLLLRFSYTILGVFQDKGERHQNVTNNNLDIPEK